MANVNHIVHVLLNHYGQLYSEMLGFELRQGTLPSFSFSQYRA